MIGPTIEETTDFIIQAHGEQTRRGKDIPYYTHPIAVSNLATDIAKEFKIPDDVIDDAVRTALCGQSINSRCGGCTTDNKRRRRIKFLCDT